MPGTEKGVRLATRLADDLNLKGNSYENIEAMTSKSEMQKRIAQHGLRSIKGKVVKSVEEAIEFYEKENLNKVIIKPIYGAASVSVKISSNKDELIKNIKEVLGEENVFGDINSELLIQEYIEGVEYIVNTVSSNGKHGVTLIWKY